jgi:hypothetical protein
MVFVSRELIGPEWPPRGIVRSPRRYPPPIIGSKSQEKEKGSERESPYLQPTMARKKM